VAKSNAARALRRLADCLALERNLMVIASAILVITMGKEMWGRFVPQYLKALGAGTAVISL